MLRSDSKMNISIITESFKASEVFYKDKFNVTFKDNDTNGVYVVTVYKDKEHIIELEESELITRNFSGEYWLEGKRLIFHIAILLEDYNVYKENNNFMVFSSFDIK